VKLPYGRAVECYYAGWRWPDYVRCGHAVLVWVGWWLVVVYTGRVSWADLDRKIEREFKRKRRAA